MAENPLIPVSGVDKGIVIDSPPLSLNPNLWTDGRNVRFHNNSVEKARGFTNILNDQLDVEPTFLAYWPHPDRPLYIYAGTDGRLRVIDEAGTKTNLRLNESTDADQANNPSFSDTGWFGTNSDWQFTLFNGGHTIVLYDGVRPPVALRADNRFYNDTSDLAQLSRGFVLLPGWSPNYDAGNADAVTVPGAAAGAITTNAGVISSFGNVLIAGNLTFTQGNSVDFGATGTLRISSRAAPGALPASWTPGALGQASTADELELSVTSPITAINELQGSAIVFTQDSIHQIDVTQTATVVRNLSDGYGALTRDSVLQFDGKLLVIGSNDIYLFGGHAAAINSVADGVIREYFYENLSQTNQDNLFMIRDTQNDEIWICYPRTDSQDGSANEALRWNYRENTWAISDLPNAFAGVDAPITGGGIAGGDFAFTTTINTNQIQAVIPSSFTTTGVDSDTRNTASGRAVGTSAVAGTTNINAADGTRAAQLVVTEDTTTVTASPRTRRGGVDNLTSSNTINTADQFSFSDVSGRSFLPQFSGTWASGTPQTSRLGGVDYPNTFLTSAINRNITAGGAATMSYSFEMQTGSPSTASDDIFNNNDINLIIFRHPNLTVGDVTITGPASVSNSSSSGGTFTLNLPAAGSTRVYAIRTGTNAEGVNNTITITFEIASQNATFANMTAVWQSPNTSFVQRRTRFQLLRTAGWTGGDLFVRPPDTSGPEPGGTVINRNGNIVISGTDFRTGWPRSTITYELTDLAIGDTRVSSRWNFTGPGVNLTNQTFALNGTDTLTTALSRDTAMSNVAARLTAQAGVTNATYNQATRRLTVNFTTAGTVTFTAASTTATPGGAVNGNASWTSGIVEAINVAATSGTGADASSLSIVFDNPVGAVNFNFDNRTIAQVLTEIVTRLNAITGVQAENPAGTQEIVFTAIGVVPRSVSFIQNGAQFAQMPIADVRSTSDTERPWPDDEFNLARTYPVFAVADSFNLQAGNVGFTNADGTNYESFVERRFITLDGRVDRQLNVKTMYPFLDGAPVTISVAAKDFPSGTPTYDDSFIFDPTEHYKYDTILGGRYFSFRFEDEGDASWSLTGFNIEAVDRGDR